MQRCDRATKNEPKMAPRGTPGLGIRSPLGEFDRIFEDFRPGMGEFLWRPPFLPMVPTVFEGTRHALVDVQDLGKEFLVVAELPGVKKEDPDIGVTEDSLEIKGEVKLVKEEEPEYYHRERGHLAWYRRLPLPADVIPDRAEAELREGILEVRLPKQEPMPEKKIRKVRVK